MNFKPTSKTPVENIVWTKTPPSGTYRVGVRHYKIQHKNRLLSKIPLISSLVLKNETDFKVRVTIGKTQRVYEGKINHNKINNELLFIAKFAIAEMAVGESKPKELVLEKENKQNVEEEAGSKKVVESTVEMTWDTSSDLGLSLQKPDGQMVSFLDIGKNEDIVFKIDENDKKQSIELNKPIKGSYSVFIEEYETVNDNGSSNYIVMINHKDGSKEKFEGEISREDGKIEIGNFEIK